MRENNEYQVSDEFENAPYESDETDLERDELDDEIGDDEFEEQDREENDELGFADPPNGGASEEATTNSKPRPKASANVDRKKTLLKVVNDVFNLVDEYKSKAIYVGKEFNEFKERVERDFYLAVYGVPTNDSDDFARMRRENATEIRREQAKSVSPDLSDEGFDKEFGRIVRELFYHAGGTLLGRDPSDPYTSASESTPRGSSAEDSVRVASPSSSTDAVRFGAFEPDQPKSSSSSSARSSTSNSQNYSGLGAYRQARRQAQDEKQASSASSSAPSTGSALWLYYHRSIAAIVTVFVPGSTVDACSFKSFLRFALLRLCPDSIVTDDSTEFSIREYFRKTLDYSAPLAKKNVALLQLVERCVGMTDSENEAEQFGLAGLSTFFHEFSKRVSLDSLSCEEIFWTAMTALTSFGRRFCSFGSLETEDDWRFDDEYVRGAQRLLSARFAARQFNGDMSDFGDFQKAFTELMGRGAKISTDRLRDVFLQAGGLFTNAAGETVEPVREKWDGSRGDLVKKIVAEDFPSGLDVESEEELEKFREIGRSYGVAFFEEPSEKLRSIIVPRCIVRDHTIYSVLDKQKKRIKELVESYFRIGAKALYFDAYFNGNEKLLVDSNIPDAEVFRAFLVSCFPKYFFTPYYMEAEADDDFEVLKIRNEIQRVWSGDEKITLDELCARVFVSRDRLEAVLILDAVEFDKVDSVYIRRSDVTEKVNWDALNSAFLVALGLNASDQIAVVGKRFFDSDKDVEREPDASDETTDEQDKTSNGVHSEKATKDATSQDNEAESDDPWAQKQTLLWNEENGEGASELYNFNTPSSDETADESDSSSNVKDDQESGTEYSPESESTPKPDRAAKKSARAKSDKDKKEQSERVDKRSEPNKTLVDVSTLDQKTRHKVIASALVQFSEGFDLSDGAALEKFHELMTEAGYSFTASEDEVLGEIRRVGFVVDGSVYVVRKKFGLELQGLVNAWFEDGGELIYYSAFYERNRDWLSERGFPTESVLVNRLRRYFSDGAFYDEYFELEQNDEQTEDEKIYNEIIRVWDGASSKRVSDLALQLYVPADKLAEVMEMYSDEFAVRSNGYWKRIQKGVVGRKRSSQLKRKSARKRSNG